MILSSLLEEVTIRNMGKLILDEELDYEKFNENVIAIVNYDLIELPRIKDICGSPIPKLSLLRR